MNKLKKYLPFILLGLVLTLVMVSVVRSGKALKMAKKASSSNIGSTKEYEQLLKTMNAEFDKAKAETERLQAIQKPQSTASHESGE